MSEEANAGLLTDETRVGKETPYRSAAGSCRVNQDAAVKMDVDGKIVVIDSQKRNTEAPLS